MDAVTETLTLRLCVVFFPTLSYIPFPLFLYPKNSPFFQYHPITMDYGGMRTHGEKNTSSS
jgi:hypothetical protein